jgi:predicted O-methyltransferase YrrM
MVWNFLGEDRIDVLFVDGDKSAFFADHLAYLPLMAPNGVEFFHDVNEAGSPMQQAWSAVAAGRCSKLIVDTSDAEAALKREARGIPPANAHEGWLRHWRERSCGVGVVWLEGSNK